MYIPIGKNWMHIGEGCPIMDILYEDKYIIAVNKPAGLATQTKRLGEKDLYSEVKNYLKGGYVGIINRLDQPVSGVVLMAKSKQAAAKLESQIADKSIKKHYRAEVYDGSGILKTGDEKTLNDYIITNPKENLSCCVEADSQKSMSASGAKKASLEYRVIHKDDDNSVATLDILLHTGRHHQIRCQLEHAGLPILGDRRYGCTESISKATDLGIKNLKLTAYSYEFIHPITGKVMNINIG